MGDSKTTDFNTKMVIHDLDDLGVPPFQETTILVAAAVVAVALAVVVAGLCRSPLWPGALRGSAPGLWRYSRRRGPGYWMVDWWVFPLKFWKKPKETNNTFAQPHHSFFLKWLWLSCTTVVHISGFTFNFPLKQSIQNWHPCKVPYASLPSLALKVMCGLKPQSKMKHWK